MNIKQKGTKYGCVMMYSEIPNWKNDHLNMICLEDLYEKQGDDSFGREEYPHITVLHGIHDDETAAEVIVAVMKQNMKPITLRAEYIDIFENGEYDVVKYNLSFTDELKEYRDILCNFPNTQIFPDYKPHMTLAYVKAGRGKKYRGKLKEPFDINFTHAAYSYHHYSNSMANIQHVQRQITGHEKKALLSVRVQND